MSCKRLTPNLTDQRSTRGKDENKVFFAKDLQRLDIGIMPHISSLAG